MRVLVALAFLSALSPQIHAEQKVFRYRVVEINSKPVENRFVEVTISRTQIRKDQGRDTLILDTGAKKAFLIDHDLQENFEFDLPFRRDDVLAGSALAAVRLISSQHGSEIVDTSSAAETTTIAGLECRDHTIRTRSASKATIDTVDFCLAVEPLPESALYWQLIDFEKELMLGTAELWRRLSEIGGFPLRWRFDLRKENWRNTQTYVLEEIEVAETDPSRFLPHPDYKRSLPDPEGRFLSRPRTLPGF